MAGFGLDAIFPLEYFQTWQLMDEIVRFLCLCKSVLSLFEFNFGDDFVHQVIGITSRCQACSKVFNRELKQTRRRRKREHHLKM